MTLLMGFLFDFNVYFQICGSFGGTDSNLLALIYYQTLPFDTKENRNLIFKIYAEKLRILREEWVNSGGEKTLQW